MKLTVFGATGGTGQQIVAQALSAHHDVTAVVRTSGKLADPRIHEVAADIMDPTAITEAIQSSDAVISAIGPRGNGPTTVCVDSARSIMQAMQATGVTRFVMVSAAGFHTNGDGPFVRFLVKPILKRALRHPFADMARAEEAVFASDLEWTILRPPQLKDKPGSGSYRTAVNRTVPRGFTVARADVADCALRCLERSETHRTAIAVAN